MYLFEMMSTLITPITLLYIFLFLMMYGQRYLRAYTKNKMLKFTQEEVKEKCKEISKAETNIKLNNKHFIGNPESEEIDIIIKIFSLYNELAVGINEGLYDELYVKMVLGYDMIDFYKHYYKMIVSTADGEKNLDRFMPLELLLKSWDKKEATFYEFKSHRRSR